MVGIWAEAGAPLPNPQRGGLWKVWLAAGGLGRSTADVEQALGRASFPSPQVTARWVVPLYPVFMSQASSSTGRTQRSSAARNALQPRPLAIVATSTEPTGVDLEAPVDYDTGLPLIICPDCKDVRVFAANTKSGSNIGKRYFKCPRKNYSNGTCIRFWFKEEYVVYLHDKGHLPSAFSTVAAASTTEVHELVGKIDSLEQNVNMVKEMVGKNREGRGSCICLVCGCVNML
nr:conserved hypothetical protein [Saccharum hybrid cultivar R570]